MFLGAEDERDVAGRGRHAFGRFGKPVNGLALFAAVEGAGAVDEFTIGDGFAKGGEFAGGGEEGARVHSAAGFFDRVAVGLHQAETGESEVRKRARGSADVERIAGSDEYYVEVHGRAGPDTVSRQRADTLVSAMGRRAG